MRLKYAFFFFFFTVFMFKKINLICVLQPVPLACYFHPCWGIFARLHTHIHRHTHTYTHTMLCNKNKLISALAWLPYTVKIRHASNTRVTDLGAFGNLVWTIYKLLIWARSYWEGHLSSSGMKCSRPGFFLHYRKVYLISCLYLWSHFRFLNMTLMMTMMFMFAGGFCTEMSYRTDSVSRLQNRVYAAVWEHWHGSDVVWWGRLAQSWWGTEGSGEWDDAKEQTEAGYKSNPTGDSQRHAARSDVCQPFRTSATATATSKSDGSTGAEMRLGSFWWTKISSGFRQGQMNRRVNVNDESKYLRPWKHTTGRRWWLEYTREEQKQGEAIDTGGPDQHNRDDGCSRYNQEETKHRTELNRG